MELWHDGFIDDEFLNKLKKGKEVLKAIMMVFFIKKLTGSQRAK